MKKPRGAIARRAVVVLALCWAVTNCQRDRSTSKSPILVGSILPLTGDVASYGQAAKRGIDLAVDSINSTGGINRRPLKVLYEDDQGQATKAIAALDKLVSVNRVPLILGSAASSVTLAICPIATREHVVLITPISSSKELTGRCGNYFFRVCPSDVVQARMMADWIKSDGHNRVALIFVKNSWGQGLRDEFVERFQALGGQIVAEEACKEGDRDLRAQLSKIMAASPDALYGITYGREGGALLRQARGLAISIATYGADVWGSPELIETAKDAAKGLRIIVPSKFESPGYSTFAQAFRARYGEGPDVYATYAYDLNPAHSTRCKRCFRPNSRALEILLVF